MHVTSFRIAYSKRFCAESIAGDQLGNAVALQGIQRVDDLVLLVAPSDERPTNVVKADRYLRIGLKVTQWVIERELCVDIEDF